MNVDWTALFSPASDPDEGCAYCLDTAKPGRRHLTSVVVQRSGTEGGSLVPTTKVRTCQSWARTREM